METISEELRHADPPTADDVSRTLDGEPLTSEAAIVRHMAHLETSGLITHTGRMFRDLLDVLERDGEQAMLDEMHRLYGPPVPNPRCKT